MSKIKLCGLKRPQDIEAANIAKPDYIGFVFAKSKRQVTREQALSLKLMLDKSIKAVGVFVNEDINFAARLANEHTIDIIQLHGDENAEYISTLKSFTNVPIIKAIRVKSREDIVNAQNIDVQYLLLDAYDNKQYGGMGESFNHKLIPENIKPYFLAGGINADNVCSIIKTFNPYCIDLSSAIETDGVKDKNKIFKIVELVRSCTTDE